MFGNDSIIVWFCYQKFFVYHLQKLSSVFNFKIGNSIFQPVQWCYKEFQCAFEPIYKKYGKKQMIVMREKRDFTSHILTNFLHTLCKGLIS